MENYYCELHGKLVEYWGVEDANTEYVGLCKDCVTITKDQVLTAETVQKEIETNKNNLLSQIHEMKDKNDKILRQLNQSLKEYKEQQLMKFNQLTQSIQGLIDLLNKKSQNLQEQINQHKTRNVKLLLQFYELQIEEIDFQGKKQFIKDQFKILNIQEPFIGLEQVLNEFPFQKCESIQEISRIKSQYNSIINSTFQTRSKQPICLLHKQEIVGIDLNKNKNENRLCCIECLAQHPIEFTPINKAREIWTKYYNDQSYEWEIYQKEVMDIINNIESNYYNEQKKQQARYDKIFQILEKIREKEQLFIRNQLQKIRTSELDLTQRQNQNILIKLKNRQVKNNNQIQQQYENIKQIQHLDFSMDDNLEQFQESLRNLSFFINSIDYHIPFKYKERKELSILQNTWCFALAINTEGNLLLACSDQYIKVYELKQGNFIETQQLEGHSNYIVCLLLLEKHMEIISGGVDKQIILWKQDLSQKWQIQQILQGHCDQIFCLTKNLNQDLLISGSSDQSIVFWNRQETLLIQSQKIDLQLGTVYSLSLNQSENKLVACTQEKYILVFEMNKNWELSQTIRNHNIGFRLCFIDDDQFVIQSQNKDIKNSNTIDFFRYNVNKKQFSPESSSFHFKTDSKRDIYYCPLKFIRSKRILLTKQYNQVNLIKILENNHCKCEQSIEFFDSQIFGDLTDNGEYLILWDRSTKKIQVRQFSEII